MHIEARHFTEWVKSVVPGAFSRTKVLDVGGGDINGNNRFLFSDCDYTANDVVAAPNVSIVSKTKDLPFAPDTFDTIISTECFEHDVEWRASIAKVTSMLKRGGLFAFTCASTGRPEHGTRRTSPQDSYSIKLGEATWSDYYANLTAQDIRGIPGFVEAFPAGVFYYNSRSKDLYFIGVKGGARELFGYSAQATARV